MKQVLPADAEQDFSDVISASKSLIRDVLHATQLREDTGLAPTPILIDRLSFCWEVLVSADALIKSTSRRKDAITAVPTTDSLRAVFDGNLPVPCLSVSFLRASADVLELEEGGGFLPRYVEFLTSKRETTGTTVGLADRRTDPGQRARLVWWIIRRRREQYIEAPKSESTNRIQYDYLVNQVVSDLQLWGGDAARKIKALSDLVESQIDRWLVYSCLDDEHAPADDSARRKMVSAVCQTQPPKGFDQAQVSWQPKSTRELNELRKEITRYAEENRTLETHVRQLEAKIASQPKHEPTPKPSEPERSGPDPIQELREVLKLIDSKYAFDVLHGIRMGDESFLTMKNFLSHFFYALRKKAW